MTATYNDVEPLLSWLWSPGDDKGGGQKELPVGLV